MINVRRQEENPMGRESTVVWLLTDDDDNELTFFNRKKDAVRAKGLIDAGNIPETGNISAAFTQWLFENDMPEFNNWADHGGVTA